MQLRRVVVTGLGAVTPVGNSAPETWQALINGVSGIAPITAFDATNFKTQFAGEVKNFDPTPLIDRKEARKMDRYSQFSVWVADEALKDSGLDLEKEDRSRKNICFVLKPEYEGLFDEFFKFATSKGMVGLKGHRLVGGFRASCYNAMDVEGVQALVDCIKEFEAMH